MGSENLSFGDAIEALKWGACVSRAGWNGKGMFIFLSRGSSAGLGGDTAPQYIDGLNSSLFDAGDEGTVTRLPCISMRTASGATLTGWLASQTDLLADDWSITAPAP
jgi:hypothetical protein